MEGQSKSEQAFEPREVLEYIEKTGIFDSLRKEIFNNLKYTSGDTAIRLQTEKSIRKSNLLPTNLFHVKQALIFTLSDNLKTCLKKDVELSRIMQQEIRKSINHNFTAGENKNIPKGSLRELILNEIRQSVQSISQPAKDSNEEREKSNEYNIKQEQESEEGEIVSNNQYIEEHSYAVKQENRNDE